MPTMALRLPAARAFTAREAAASALFLTHADLNETPFPACDQADMSLPHSTCDTGSSPSWLASSRPSRRIVVGSVARRHDQQVAQHGVVDFRQTNEHRRP